MPSCSAECIADGGKANDKDCLDPCTSYCTDWNGKGHWERDVVQQRSDSAEQIRAHLLLLSHLDRSQNWTGRCLQERGDQCEVDVCRVKRLSRFPREGSLGQSKAAPNKRNASGQREEGVALACKNHRVSSCIAECIVQGGEPMAKDCMRPRPSYCTDWDWKDIGKVMQRGDGAK